MSEVARPSSSDEVLEIRAKIFPDYNSKNDLPKDHEITELRVRRMKHKHLRKMQTMREDRQIHYIMSELTGLSSADLDELDIADSAALSRIIFNYMNEFADIAKRVAILKDEERDRR